MAVDCHKRSYESLLIRAPTVGTTYGEVRRGDDCPLQTRAQHALPDHLRAEDRRGSLCLCMCENRRGSPFSHSPEQFHDEEEYNSPNSSHDERSDEPVG